VPDGSSRAIYGADALLFYLSSPCKLELSKFVSSLKLMFFLSFILNFPPDTQCFSANHHND
ncbi:hypothetical protein ACKEWY_19255, partial [Yersinia enterocolitica]